MLAAGGEGWTSGVIASLQALTEAGAIGSLPPCVCRQLAHLATLHSCSTEATAVLPPELAYGDLAAAGNKGTLVPPPLQQQENMQLQLWWAAATAAAGGQLGLASQQGEALRGLLTDDSIADVAFEMQNPCETIMAHDAIIAAGCPKLYKAVQQAQHCQEQQQQQQQQQQGNQESSIDGLVHVQLGRSVKAGPFRQVLEYLYTGQVLTLTSDEDRLALRKLAHALELPQLAALAAGIRQTPGADYTPMSLAGIMPTQHVQIPWDRAMSGQDSHKGTEQQQLHRGSTTHPVDAQHESVFVRETEVVMDDPGGAEHRPHPSIDKLLGPRDEINISSRLRVSSAVPAHADLLLFPCQGPQASRQEQVSLRKSDQHARRDDRAAAKSHYLQALPVHRAVLSASSPYFAAMLSDRWQASSAAGTHCSGSMLQDGSRCMSAAHVPTEDMEVVSAFVHFCYTQELVLLPSLVCHALAEQRTMSDVCDQCWSARTAVRLSVAAEAWMVPLLKGKCLSFLTRVLPDLPPECQLAVRVDLTALNAWDLAQQLSIMLDKVMT